MKKVINGTLGVGYLHERYPHMKLDSGHREIELKHIDHRMKKEELKRSVVPYRHHLPERR